MTFIKQLMMAKGRGQTVISVADASMMVPEYSGNKLWSALKYAVASGDLIRLTRGIYVFERNYSHLELANKLRIPSYVSMYTVLQKEGVVFQPYESVYMIASRSQRIEVDNQNYIYRRIKAEILLNTRGIEIVDRVSMANTERALCDKLYLDGNEHFDNLRGIDWEEMRNLNRLVYGGNKTIADFIEENGE